MVQMERYSIIRANISTVYFRMWQNPIPLTQNISIKRNTRQEIKRFAMHLSELLMICSIMRVWPSGDISMVLWSKTEKAQIPFINLEILIMERVRAELPRKRSTSHPRRRYTFWQHVRDISCLRKAIKKQAMKMEL